MVGQNIHDHNSFRNPPLLQENSTDLHHAHSFDCLESAGVDSEVCSHGHQHVVRERSAPTYDHEGEAQLEDPMLAGLKRMGKIATLNAGYVDDVTGRSTSDGQRARAYR